MLFGYCIDDWFDNGVEVEIEAAFDSHDRHRDIHSIFECLEEIEEIPQSFDGLPTVFDEEGNEVSLEVRVGTRIEYPDATGATRTALIYDIVSAGTEAWVCVESDGEHHIVKMPLTADEVRAVQKYGDAALGKPEKKHRNLEGDPLKFYDWITGVYQKYDRNALLAQIKGHPDIDKLSELPTEKLRIRAAREATKAAVANSGRRGQV